jgi:hypothetical protein
MVNGFASLSGVQIFVVKVGRGGVSFHFGDTHAVNRSKMSGWAAVVG